MGLFNKLDIKDEYTVEGIQSCKCPFCGETERSGFHNNYSKGITKYSFTITRGFFKAKKYRKYYCTCYTCRGQWETSAYKVNGNEENNDMLL